MVSFAPRFGGRTLPRRARFDWVLPRTRGGMPFRGVRRDRGSQPSAPPRGRRRCGGPRPDRRVSGQAWAGGQPCRRCRRGARCAGDGTVALAVIDVAMPGEDGLSLARFIRERLDIGIVMLTAADQPVDRIVGLAVGADDYVVKPFHPRELLMRVRAVLAAGLAACRRRGRRVRPRSAASGSTRRRMRCGMLDGALVPLAPMELALLRAFVGHAAPEPEPSAPDRAGRDRCRRSPSAASTSWWPGCAARSSSSRAGRGSSAPCAIAATCSCRRRPTMAAEPPPTPPACPWAMRSAGRWSRRRWTASS